MFFSIAITKTKTKVLIIKLFLLILFSLFLITSLFSILSLIFTSSEAFKKEMLTLFDLILISRNAFSRSRCDSSKSKEYLKRVRVNVFISSSFRLI